MDEGFTRLLKIYEGDYLRQLKKENEEFANKMQDIIELDSNAEEIIEFSEKCSEKLVMMSKMRREAEDIKMRTI